MLKTELTLDQVEGYLNNVKRNGFPCVITIGTLERLIKWAKEQTNTDEISQLKAFLLGELDRQPVSTKRDELIKNIFEDTNDNQKL